MSKSTQITKRLTAKIPTRGNDVTTLGDASVTTGKLADLSVSTPKIQPQAVTGDKLANDTVDFVGKHLRNYTINGNFDFWQRGTSFGSISQFVYYADRWANQSGANTSASISQQALNGTQNATYCLRWTAGSTSSQFNLTQALESIVVDQLKGKTVTFSIYARINSGNSRTYSVQVFKNATGNTLSGGSWTSLGASTPTVLSTSFQKLSVTVAVPNDGTANGLRVAILDNQTGLAADYIEIVGAMLNEGSYAAPFKTYGSHIGDELISCQRYYEKSFDINVTPTQNSGSTTGAHYFGNIASGASQAVPFISYKVSKRSSSSITTYNPSASNSQIRTIGGTVGDWSGTAVQSNGLNGFGLGGTSNATAAGSGCAVHWSADAELT